MKTKNLFILIAIGLASITNSIAASNNNSLSDGTTIVKSSYPNHTSRIEVIKIKKGKNKIKKDAKRVLKNDRKIGPHKKMHLKQDRKNLKKHVTRLRHR